jgi:pimeloyl-ACP methyl ester carboxylesterase
MAVELSFKKTGEGKPFIVLHGLFGLLDNWHSFANKLSAQGFAVFSVDLRNHGSSPHADEFNYKALAEDVAMFIDNNHLQHATLLGHSLGGKTAMQLALFQPELISSLIVVDIAPRYYAPHHQQILKALFAVDLDTVNTRSDADKIVSGFIDDNATKQFLLKNLYWHGDRLQWKFNLHAIATQIENVGEHISSTKPFLKPCLFIRGEKSNYVTANDEIEIKQLFSTVTIETAPAAGHWVHADNPDWMLQTILKFLANIN